jgi:acyl-CoA dehydrogenase
MDFTIPEDLKMLQTLARDFVKEQLLPVEREVLGRDTDLAGARVYLPAETEKRLVDLVKGMGLWGINVPEELGGVGLDTLGICLVEEELARSIVPFHFGDVSPVLFECTEEQREHYLKPLLEGQRNVYLGLIEPGDRADVPTMGMSAEKVNGGYILNGKKISYSRPGDDGFAVVFALTNPEKKLKGGVTCFLIDSDTSGFSLTNGEEKTGWQAQIAEPILLTFDNCRVPTANMLGEEGKAFQLGGKWLPSRRVVRGARCVGAAVRLLEVSAEYAKTWERFGQPIIKTPSIQTALASMEMNIHATRLMVHHAAWKADSGENIRYEAAMVKVFATEMLHRVADEAVQVHGGPGFMPALSLERLCRTSAKTSATEYALGLQRAIIVADLLERAG